MLNNKKMFDKWLNQRGVNEFERIEIVKNIEILSILTGIRVYNLSDFDKESVKKIIKEAKKFAGDILINKFRIALNFYLKMIAQK